MNRKMSRTILSLTLAIVMVFTTVGSVFAETVDEQVVMINGEITNPASLAGETVVNADVSVETTTGYATAVIVESEGDDAKDSSLTVNGSISAEAEYNATAADVSAEEGKTAELVVTGSVSADNSGDYYWYDEKKL